MALTTPSQASPRVAGLNVDGDKLILIKEKREAFKVQKVVKLKLKGSDSLLAFDIRAADNALYGVSKNAIVYKINIETGTLERQFALKADLSGWISMDCDAVADACRIVSSKGFNAHFAFAEKKLVVDKKLKYAGSDEAEAEAAKTKPEVIAIAYTNGFSGAESSQLYDLDRTLNGVFEQVPPDGGGLVAVSQPKQKLNTPLAFDILSLGPSDSTGYMVRNSRFYQLDIPTGKTRSRKISGLKDDLRDVAIFAQGK